MQVLATGRSRSTTRRSCMRRATDSDMHPVTSSSQHPVTSSSQHPVTSSSQHPVASRVLAAIGQPCSVSPTKAQASQHSSNDTQPLGASKVQRSLTWTEEGPVGLTWGTEGESDGPEGVARGLEWHSGSSPKRSTRGSEGESGGNLKGDIRGSNGSDSAFTGMDDATSQQQQHQQHQQQQQQQLHSLLSAKVLISTTVEEATSLQSSPNVQPSRNGAVQQRQRLPGSAAAGLHASESGSSNSGQVLVPDRFRAGTLALLCDAKSCPSSVHSM